MSKEPVKKPKEKAPAAYCQPTYSDTSSSSSSSSSFNYFPSAQNKHFKFGISDWIDTRRDFIFKKNWRTPSTVFIDERNIIKNEIQIIWLGKESNHGRGLYWRFFFFKLCFVCYSVGRASREKFLIRCTALRCAALRRRRRRWGGGGGYLNAHSLPFCQWVGSVFSSPCLPAVRVSLRALPGIASLSIEYLTQLWHLPRRRTHHLHAPPLYPLLSTVWLLSSE